MFHRRAIFVGHLASVSGAILATALAAGCASSVEQRGNLPEQDRIAEIHPGSTTKDEVIKITNIVALLLLAILAKWAG